MSVYDEVLARLASIDERLAKIEAVMCPALIFAINDDDPAADELLRKFCENPRPGSIVRLTEDEHEALKSGVLHWGV